MAGTTKTGDPKRTVYVHNLNEKIKLTELKQSLYGVMSQFGAILEVKCRKSLKTRGQAWIAFQEVASAATAVKNLEGFTFYDKAMKLSFAMHDGDAVAQMLVMWLC